MNKPHKHAEIIKLWADGAEVQQKYCGDDWRPFDGSWTERDEWKFCIKPEPRPDVVEYHNIYPNHGHSTYENAKYSARGGSKGIVKITFDGETGALKAAEVLK